MWGFSGVIKKAFDLRLCGYKFNSLTIVRRRALLGLAVVLFASGFACAQTIGTGSIQGTVFDATGAALPGASVKAVNPETGYNVTQQTSAAGVYVLGQLPPADYTVTVSAAGF